MLPIIRHYVLLEIKLPVMRTAVISIATYTDLDIDRWFPVCNEEASL